MRKYDTEYQALKIWEQMNCECNGDDLCNKCAIKQATDDGYYMNEICFDCCQPLVYCTCKNKSE